MSASCYLSHQQLRLRWEEPFCHLVAVPRNCTSHTHSAVKMGTLSMLWQIRDKEVETELLRVGKDAVNYKSGTSIKGI